MLAKEPPRPFVARAVGRNRTAGRFLRASRGTQALSMSVSRVVIVFFALSPFAFGASKEIMELQRDVALLQDQVRTLQSALDQKVAAVLTLTQQTLDSVN